MKTTSIPAQTTRGGLRRTKLQLAGAAVACFASSIALCRAEIIEFDLSPAGSDTATGLSPVNQVPPVPGSTGSGNEISDGIRFDTDSSVLSIAVGYGSAAGFSDLTGAASTLYLHGPAAAAATAPALFDLATRHFPAGDPTKGGVLFGTVAYSPEQAADLLAGRNYLSIQTEANPAGELRGQLIPVTNQPPSVVCPANATVECGVEVTYTANVSDADGDALQVLWILNGEQVQASDVPAGAPTTAAEVEYTAALPSGVNTLTVTAIDTAGNVSSCTATITVEDTTPPEIVKACVTPKKLWPPNHKMVPVRVSATVTDNCGEATWRIVSITSNEKKDDKGSGSTAPDWLITGDATAKLRAERSGKNKVGRIYTITIEASDAAGNVSEPATLTVTVPHSMGKPAKKPDPKGKPGSAGKEKDKDKDKNTDKNKDQGKGKPGKS